MVDLPDAFVGVWNVQVIVGGDAQVLEISKRADGDFQISSDGSPIVDILSYDANTASLVSNQGIRSISYWERSAFDPSLLDWVYAAFNNNVNGGVLFPWELARAAADDEGAWGAEEGGG